MTEPWRDRWWRAVELGGAGHYASAAAVLAALRHDPRHGPVAWAHAAVTRASHLRQLGGHAAAAVLDAEALRIALPLARADCPPGYAGGRAAHPTAAAPTAAAPTAADPMDADAAGAVADALTGLAADALGRFDTATADRLLDRATPWCRPGGRSIVRHGWVRAETALVRGEPTAALAAADRALAGARTLGSSRHELKSGLIRAVAAGAAGHRDGPTVLVELDAVAARAGAAGLLPLHRAALLAAADLAARHAETSRFDTHRRQADAESRRHAAMRTVSVLLTRCDGTGRALLRASSPEVPPEDVPYGLLHSATLHPHDAEPGGPGCRTEGTKSPRPCQGERGTRRFGG